MSHNITIEGGTSVRLPTAGKYCDRDIVITATGGGGVQSKLPSVIDRTVTEITSDDLAGVTKVGNYAFSGCTALENVSLPNSVTEIGAYAFSECKALKSISLPSGLTQLNGQCFQYCASLTTVDIPDSVQKLSLYVFNNCTELQSVTIGDGVETIGMGCFEYCSKLTKLNIPPKVTELPNYFVSGCRLLVNLTIPANVKRMGNGALRCGISNTPVFVLLPEVPPTIQSNTFNYVKQIIVPKGCGDAYKTATNWSKYASKIVEAET